MFSFNRHLLSVSLICAHGDLVMAGNFSQATRISAAPALPEPENPPPTESKAQKIIAIVSLALAVCIFVAVVTCYSVKKCRSISAANRTIHSNLQSEATPALSSEYDDVVDDFITPIVPYPAPPPPAHLMPAPIRKSAHNRDKNNRQHLGVHQPLVFYEVPGQPLIAPSYTSLHLYGSGDTVNAHDSGAGATRDKIPCDSAQFLNVKSALKKTFHSNVA